MQHDKRSFSPQVLAALEFSQQLAGQGQPGNDPIASARMGYRSLAALAGDPQPVFRVDTRRINSPAGDIPIRIYRPSDESGLPVILFFHGGWFFAGDFESHDRPLRALTNATQCILIAVDYRLAPEHPFPAGVEDAINALRWVVQNGEALDADTSRIAIVGDSAGGALAAVTARKAAENKMSQVRLQVLLYPVADSSLSTDSWKAFADGPVVTLATAQQAWSLYTPGDKQRQNPDAAPLRAVNLQGLPPALVIVGEYDPLRDEGLAYAKRLSEAGVPVKEHLYPGMPHGFFQMAAYIDAGKEAIAEVAQAVTKALNNDL